MQYGCGWSAPEGWLNFDASPTLIFERVPLIGRLYTRNARRFPKNVRYGDIVKGLPIAPNSCAGIYACHILEHLALNDFETALANTYRYLKPDGVFRLVVPDLESLARSYLSNGEELAAVTFIDRSGIGVRARSRGLSGLMTSWLGNSQHLWLWDEKALSAKLRVHHFRDIRRATFGDAEDLRFREVEDPGRFEDAVAIQCRK